MTEIKIYAIVTKKVEYNSTNIYLNDKVTYKVIITAVSKFDIKL